MIHTDAFNFKNLNLGTENRRQEYAKRLGNFIVVMSLPM